LFKGKLKKTNILLKLKYFFYSKEFDELQEKKIQVSEQYRTIIGPQQGVGMSITNNNMNYSSGRQQR